MNWISQCGEKVCLQHSNFKLYLSSIWLLSTTSGLTGFVFSQGRLVTLLPNRALFWRSGFFHWFQFVKNFVQWPLTSLQIFRLIIPVCRIKPIRFLKRITLESVRQVTFLLVNFSREVWTFCVARWISIGIDFLYFDLHSTVHCCLLNFAGYLNANKITSEVWDELKACDTW